MFCFFHKSIKNLWLEVWGGFRLLIKMKFQIFCWKWSSFSVVSIYFFCLKIALRAKITLSALLLKPSASSRDCEELGLLGFFVCVNGTRYSPRWLQTLLHVDCFTCLSIAWWRTSLLQVQKWSIARIIIYCFASLASLSDFGGDKFKNKTP